MDNISNITIPTPHIEMMPSLGSLKQSAIETPFNLPEPFATLLMIPLLPFMPLVLLIQYQQAVINQSSNNNAPKGKVTQIIRNESELTIIEKYL
jgi:hypothetical protein